MRWISHSFIIRRGPRLILPAGIAAMFAVAIAGFFLRDLAARRFVILYVAPTLGVAALWLQQRLERIKLIQTLSVE